MNNNILFWYNSIIIIIWIINIAAFNEITYFNALYFMTLVLNTINLIETLKW
jgi:hypothetical protein